MCSLRRSSGPCSRRTSRCRSRSTCLVLVIFGGMGSITGVLIGATFVGWFTQFLIFHSFIDYNDADKYMYLGAILVLTMIFRPQGMLPSKRRLREFQDAEAGLGTADALDTAVGVPAVRPGGDAAGVRRHRHGLGINDGRSPGSEGAPHEFGQHIRGEERDAAVRRCHAASTT